MSQNGFTEDAFCILCGLGVPQLLTWAHQHRRKPRRRRAKGDRGRFLLCWTCHRAYDLGIVTTKELIAAERAALMQNRRLGGSPWRRWRRDLKAGTRRVDMRLQHGLSPVQLMRNAKKAVKTMRDRKLRQREAGVKAAKTLREKKRRLHLIAMKAARRRAANKLAAFG